MEGPEPVRGAHPSDIVFVDVETYFERCYSLRDSTLAEYVHDPRFKIYGVGVSFRGRRHLLTEDEFRERAAKTPWRHLWVPTAAPPTGCSAPHAGAATNTFTISLRHNAGLVRFARSPRPTPVMVRGCLRAYMAVSAAKAHRFKLHRSNSDMARGKHRPSFGDLHDHDGFPSFPGARLLAEGDSWFTVSGLPAFNLLFALRFHKPTEIVNLAQPGDQIRKMVQIAASSSLRRALSPGGPRWDGILLSGGGNDLIDEADDILLDKADHRPNGTDPADFCDQTKLRALIEDVQDAYRKIAAMRDGPRGPGSQVPMLTHTYDYATPRNAPARFFFARLGPWLFTALKASEVPESHRVAVADYLADTLADGLLALSKGPNAIKNFHVVDTRGLLKRAQLGHPGDSNDWQNEIHPNDDGYKKIAKKIEPVLEPLIGTV